MSGDAYAVLVGIDEYKDVQSLAPLSYAQKDCRDFHKVLADPAISDFPPQNIRILLGEEATTRNVEEALYTFAVRNVTEEDTVLIYFSGHGFIAGDQQLPYLGTYDVRIKDLLRNPNMGLRMDRLHDDIFMTSPARHVLFILDCCHSGALTPSSIRSSDESGRRSLIDRSFFSHGTGRIAFVACPPDAVSRESSDLQNGIFTHFLLRGLRGEAVESDEGEVTLDSLLAYVRSHTPSEQPPGTYGQWFGRIVLSRPRIEAQSTQQKLEIKLDSAICVEAKSLSNPLEPYILFVKNLLSELSDDEPPSDSYPENRVLDAIRRASEAEFVFELVYYKNNWIVKAQSEVSKDCTNQAGYSEQAVSRAISSIANKVSLQWFHHDSYYPYEESPGVSKAFIAIPLHLGHVNEFIIVYGLRPDSYLLGDVYSRILHTVYTATRGMTTVQPANIESAILDSLKRSYGYVPLEIYNRRYELFIQRLREMVVFFEPILFVEPGNLYICGWEALARDSASMQAPTDLFGAAELWGRRFVTELDMYFLREATVKHREALREAKMQRPYESQELSINVYPESLMRTAYYNAVSEAIKESSILPHKLVLEISEKAPIPEEAGDIKQFKKRLEKFVKELRISFGIDDFGVGYASVSRLTRLNPTHVKIDREVLHHRFSDIAIRFVLDISTHDRLHAPRVIIEGFDSAAQTTLEELYNLGIRYVQGYIVGRAGPKLYRLDKEVIQYLENLIRRNDLSA